MVTELLENFKGDKKHTVLILSSSNIFFYQHPNFMIFFIFALSKVALNFLLNLRIFRNVQKAHLHIAVAISARSKVTVSSVGTVEYI